VQFEQDGGDQSQERVVVGEDLDDVDAALDLAVDPLQWIEASPSSNVLVGGSGVTLVDRARAG
jgi:hypothetical protein